jgi:Icc-related predicted phosphoesterase
VRNLDLIAISDIYGDISLAKGLVSMLGRSESENRIIVIAGDMSIKTAPERDVEGTLSLLSAVCKHLFYLPGDADTKEFETSLPNAKNLDKRNCIAEIGGVKVGLLGLGGAPTQSVRSEEPLPYLWDENIPVVGEGLSTELKINIEKVVQGHPDHIVLVTHSPPYGIADRSKPITLREMIVLEDLVEELKGETKPEPTEVAEPKKKVTTSPRHLGSRILREFVKFYKPDIHIFGHVHKEGGKAEFDEATKFFNVSHLCPLPYRLTGRKFLKIKISKDNISATFDHIILERNIPFHDFIEKYL